MSDKQLWRLAHIQATQVKRIKAPAAKDRQIVLLCETWKKALRSGK